ncbi:GNAT family N-acetyltransferase [Nocardioides rubriscoriae]|uniref:GNAT family N-acetyltransferase n=1 Tax=Nocardioides rubriscoriae TaxID=642762 RepID=UPI001478D7FF|nr:GNAT family N-acetyltransferase [Nocardioides rubriscoriae]
MSATVRLRAFVPADEPAVAALFAEPDVAQWNPGPADLDPARWCADNNRGAEGTDFRTWAVADPDDDRFLGTVSVFGMHDGHGEAEIGYRVRAAETGRGVATAAVAAACRRAFTELAPTSIRLQHAVVNGASCRVALRSGFALVATLPGTEPYGDGQLYDEHLHRLVDLSRFTSSVRTG